MFGASCVQPDPVPPRYVSTSSLRKSVKVSALDESRHALGVKERHSLGSIKDVDGFRNSASSILVAQDQYGLPRISSDSNSDRSSPGAVGIRSIFFGDDSQHTMPPGTGLPSVRAYIQDKGSSIYQVLDFFNPLLGQYIYLVNC